MKQSAIRFNRYYIFLSLSLFLSLFVLTLSGCGGEGYSSYGSRINTYVAGAGPFGNAIDSSGNVWVANGGNGTPGTASGDSNVTELSSSGAVIGTYVAGTVPIGIAIDKSGNVWVENYGDGIVGTAPGDSNVTELVRNSSGAVIATNTYLAGSYPAGGIAVDTAGNIWVTNWGAASGTPGTPGPAQQGESNVTELLAAGGYANSNTYVAGSSPGGIAIDKSGNVWVANKGDGTPGTTALLDSNVTELLAAGNYANSNTFVAGTNPEGIAIDPSGNVWVVNKGNLFPPAPVGTPGMAPGDSNVTELVRNSSGAVIATNTYVVGSLPETVAIDSSGDIWVTNGYDRAIGQANIKISSVMELNSSGAVIHTYSTGNQPYSIAIDPSGNVWVTNYGNGTAGTDSLDSNVQEYMRAANGPEYFPYSGPMWPCAQ